MTKNTLYWIMALLAGVLLALMISLNSSLSTFTSPLFASWLAHGIGAACAFLLIGSGWKLSRKHSSADKNKTTDNTTLSKPPFWSYLGGIPGALTVVLAAITVNSSIGLSGTLALGLIGQIVFSLISDHFGLFGVPKKPFVWRDLLMVFSITLGSFLLIYFKG